MWKWTSSETGQEAAFDLGCVKTLEPVASGQQKNQACGLDESFMRF
jgi:hypothetical protein